MNGYFKDRVRWVKVLPLLALVMLYPAAGFCIDNNYWNTGLNFHFYPPGARSLGMGGAFVGLADDATAAVSNPAGIAQLNRMQLAIEGRYLDVDSKQKTYPLPGAIGPLHTMSNEDDVQEISFGAFTTPVFNNLFNIAVFYDKPMNFSVDKKVNFQNVFGSVFNPNGLRQYQDVSTTTDINIDEVGVSVAKSFVDGRLMLGFGLGAQFFDYKSRLKAPVHLTDDATFDVVTSNFKARTGGNEVGLSYRLGILAKPIDQLRLGFSYTHMPKFDMDWHQNNFIGTQRTGSAEDVTSFDVPDNFALGAAYNITPNWVAVFEAKYIMYSELMNRFSTNITYLNPQGRFDESGASEFSMDDVMEIHFGTEYVLNAIPNVPIALRAGLFYEPAHDLKYTGSNPTERRLFDGGDDLIHFTVGTGLVLFNHYQIDVGGDFTEDSRNVALSMVYQF